MVDDCAVKTGLQVSPFTFLFEFRLSQKKTANVMPLFAASIFPYGCRYRSGEICIDWQGEDRQNRMAGQADFSGCVTLVQHRDETRNGELKQWMEKSMKL